MGQLSTQHWLVIGASVALGACGGRTDDGRSPGLGVGGGAGTAHDGGGVTGGIGGTGAAGSGGTGASGGGVGVGGVGGTGATGTGASGGTGAVGGSGGVLGCGNQYLGLSCTDVSFGIPDCDRCAQESCCGATDECFSDPYCAGLLECFANYCSADVDVQACVDRFCSPCLTDQSIHLYNAMASCIVDCSACQ